MMFSTLYAFKVKRLGQASSAAISTVPLHKPLGVLGRGQDCDYILADPDRILSRRHAEIEQRDGRVYWTDLGTNASQIDGVPLVQGSRRALQPGDQVHAGPFALTLQLHDTQNIWNTPELLFTEVAGLQDLPLPNHEVLGIDDLLRDDAPLPTPDIQTPWMAMRVPLGQPHAVANHADSNSDDKLQALLVALQGALGLKPTFKLEADHLVLIASLFRSLLVGCHQLLASRGIVRAEMGTSHTVIGPSANNPMKCVARTDELMVQLLQPTRQGFLTAPHSVECAVQDLLAHQQFSTQLLQLFATQMRHALAPSTIEHQHAAAAGLDLSFPVQKKARLWDEYCKQFHELAGSSDSPFSELLQRLAVQLNQTQTDGNPWK